MRWLAAFVMLAAACACNGAADDDPLAPDADPSAPDAPPGCGAVPDPAPAWLSSYQDGIVATLAGTADRATPTRRAAAADYLDTELGSLGYQVQRHDYGTGTNVWVELPSDTGGTRWVVFGAHYDTVSNSPGANDNATGVAMVLSAARHLRDLDCRQVGFIFVLFDQEEIGLVGSGEFATLLAGGTRDVAAVHTVDQMGWDEDGDRAVELERPSSGLYELYQAAVTSGALGITLHETTTGSTDHVSFRQRGFRAVGLTEEFVNGDTTPHYHASTDTYSTVNFAYLASSSELVQHAFAQVARGDLNPAMPPLPRPPPQEAERGHSLLAAPAGQR